MFAYAENSNLTTDVAREKDAAEAGSIECTDLLSPVTKAFVVRARVTEQPYAEWISLSAPLVDEKKKAQREKISAGVGQGLGGLLGAASMASSLQMTEAGNTAGAALANQNMASAAQIVSQSEEEAKIADNKITELDTTLESFKNTFATTDYRQTTIRIYGKVLTVSGKLDQQMAEFRAVVKAKLNASATAGSAPQP